MSSGWVGILVLGGLLLVVVAVLFYSFVATDESQPLPAPAAQAFVGQCVRAGGDEETCSCVIAQMERQYSLDQLVRLGLQAQNTGKIPDELQGAVARCSR